MFQNMLTPGRLLTLHHLGLRCRNLDATRADCERLGRPVVAAGGLGAARFMFADARATLGCYLEYVAAPPEYWAERGGPA
jgi:hypothetical protein